MLEYVIECIYNNVVLYRIPCHDMLIKEKNAEHTDFRTIHNPKVHYKTLNYVKYSTFIQTSINLLQVL
jgi:hypothetical protein